MKINVGDYVRTKNGIQQLKKENDNGWFFDKGMIIKPDNLEKYIIKSSPNIIDLIEEGDFVNGRYVSEIKDGKPFFEDYNDPYYSYFLDEDEIYTIVTKEQFESMEYKI